jgi:hypothetical protein
MTSIELFKTELRELLAGMSDEELLKSLEDIRIKNENASPTFKFYRVCNTDIEQGLWYDYTGKFLGLIHDEFSFCSNSSLKMDYDEDLVGWLSATSSIEDLYKWFTVDDILKLQSYGWCIHEYKVRSFWFYEPFQHFVICQETSVPVRKIMLIKTKEDIPSDWKVLNVRKTTTVEMRPCQGVERFKVSWSDSELVSDPETDVIVISSDNEYPCKKDIFIETYTPLKWIKKAVNQIVEIPQGVTLEVATLEGTVSDVTYPDYIAIGARGEVYVNTKKFFDESLEVVNDE